MLHLDHAWGVNVHFNRASTAQAEFDQVGAAFRAARVDFSWQSLRDRGDAPLQDGDAAAAVGVVERAES